MNATTVQLFDLGDEVEILSGELAGEQGVVENWRYASLSYWGHREDDDRVYMVLIHGRPYTMPFADTNLRAVGQ